MEVFTHIKYVIGITLSFSLAHLLKGTVKFVQHPTRGKPYLTHLLWVLYMFLTLVHFWWWEFKLAGITEWHFFTYFFIVLYITNYYVICALLYPDDINDYKDYKDYYFSRRKWLFSFLAIAFMAVRQSPIRIMARIGSSHPKWVKYSCPLTIVSTRSAKKAMAKKLNNHFRLEK